MSKRRRDDPKLMKRGAAAERGLEDETPTAPDAAREVEPGAVARLIVDAREGAVDRAAADAIAKPLGDLAQAFALQAEVLKSVHDNQQRMQSAIDDDKKSEMMLSSTKSLNETFKGVRGTQKELLEELRRERGAKTRWVWAVLVLGLGVLGLGTWTWMDRNGGVEKRQSALEGQVGEMQKSLVPRLEGEADRERDENERLRKSLEEARLDAKLASERYETSQQAMIGLRSELKDWRDRTERAEKDADAARRESRESAGQLAALKEKNRDLDDQITDYLRRAEAAEKKATRLNDEILAKLRQQGGQGVEALANAATPPPIIDGAERMAAEIERQKAVAQAAKEAAARPVSAPDPDALVKDLNRLMSKHRSNSSFRFKSIGGVKDGQLLDVVFEESVPQYGVKKEVTAKVCELQLSGRGDLVEFFFRDGTKRSLRRQTGKLGSARPFYNGEYRDSILCLNGDEWRKRNWTFLRFE